MTTVFNFALSGQFRRSARLARLRRFDCQSPHAFGLVCAPVADLADFISWVSQQRKGCFSGISSVASSPWAKWSVDQNSRSYLFSSLSPPYLFFILVQKIALKSELLRAPMYGPTMDLFQFLFLARDWVRDQAEISRLWAHFARLHWPVQLMLFPEGTDFNAKSVDKSRAFTDARNERPFKHVLAPRVAGFAHCVKEARAHRLLRAILDVTVAYETTIPENELAFMEGRLPTGKRAIDSLCVLVLFSTRTLSRLQAIHFHVERIDVSDVNEAKLEQMLFARWRRKDELLARFASKGRFKLSRGRFFFFFCDFCAQLQNTF